jgi:hypothetical protein
MPASIYEVTAALPHSIYPRIHAPYSCVVVCLLPYLYTGGAVNTRVTEVNPRTTKPEVAGSTPAFRANTSLKPCNTVDLSMSDGRCITLCITISEPQRRGYGGGLLTFAMRGGCRLHLRRGVFESPTTDPTPFI